jgi:diaminohydroxyphosphoribosylaminopyrimidine deaminase/5-amino-6-(5-phosphoribosylamino)uracil reductase
MKQVSDYTYMTRALQLAERGLYTTDPNPRVGCVIVKSGQIVGEGWHARAGGPHAEIHAREQAGEMARGATAYVTLEPCCHHGKTPPCSAALIEAGVARVVVAMGDPNPLVAGSGLRELQQAGIEVESGLLETQARALNPGFVKRMSEGRPLVRCKLAMSLDGRTAMASGESKWITGEAARHDVHLLRARSSAIISGIGTVLADDPALDIRLEDEAPEGGWLQPLRVILDPHLSTPVNARLLGLPGRKLIVTTVDEQDVRKQLQSDTTSVVVLQDGVDHIDLHGLMKMLAELEVNEVLLETGATLSGAMLQAGLIDELIVYMAPHLMGNGARGLFNLPGLEQMSQRLQLEIEDIRPVGKDFRIMAKVST